MSSFARQTAPTSLIVGCGYLGRQVASRLLKRGVTVYGTTRTPTGAVKLAQMGVRPLLAEVTQRLTLASLRPALEAAQLDVYYLVPPGRPGGQPAPRQVVIDGLANVLALLRDRKVRRAVLTSSTSVYGGQRVDADSPADPTDERGRLLLESESLWLGASQAHHVVRLAGLYGRGRVIGFQALRHGAPLVGDPQALLNLIHVEDAADLLLATMAADAPTRVELGCDDAPAPRIEYYRHLAALIGAPQPAVMEDAAAAEQLGLDLQRLRRGASRHCDNTATRRRTGWAPRFADYRAGLEQALAHVDRAGVAPAQS